MAASAVVVQHQQAGAEEQSTGRAGRAELLRQQQQAAAQLQVHGQRPDYAFGYVQSISSCSPVQLPLCRISIVIALAFYTRSGVYRHSSFTSSAFTYKHPQPAEIRCHIRFEIKSNSRLTSLLFSFFSVSSTSLFPSPVPIIHHLHNNPSHSVQLNVQCISMSRLLLLCFPASSTSLALLIMTMIMIPMTPTTSLMMPPLPNPSHS